MKVLVTGISGLLGSNIAHLLRERGYDFAGMARKTSNLSSLKDLDFEKRRGVIQDPGEVKQAMEGCDVVIHAAADTNHFTTAYKQAFEINYTGLKNVIEAAKFHGVKKLIYIGTANVFGNGTASKPGDELSPFAYLKNNSAYIQSKYLAHQLIQEEAANGFPVVALNPTFMLGAYDAKPSSGQMILYALSRKVVFAPPGGKNFVHVRDVATAAVNAIEKGKPGESYLLGHENLSYKAFFNLVKEVSGKNFIQVKIPAAALLTIGKAGEFFQKLTGLHSQVTVSNTQLLCAMHYYSSAKAQKDLDFPQTPVKEAIKDAVDWFRANGYMK